MLALKRGRPETRNAARAMGGVSPKLGGDRMAHLYIVSGEAAMPGRILLAHWFRPGELESGR